MAAPLDTDDAPRRYDRQLAGRLFAYVRPWRGLVAGAVALIMAQAGLQLVGPLLTRWVIDDALPARDARGVTMAAVLFALAMGAQFAVTYGETVLTALLGQRVMRDLRHELFTHLQLLPVRVFDRTPVGRLVTRTTNDVEALNELFTSGVVAALGDVVTLVAIGVVMLVIDWQLALTAFLVIPFVFLASRVFQSRVRVAYRAIRTRLAQLNAFIQERLAGVRVVQLFGQESRERERFRALNDAHLDAHVRSIRVYALYFPIIEFLTTLALASLIVGSGARVYGGALTVGTVAAFLQLVRRFFQPLQDLSEKFNVLQGAMAASERIFGLLDTPVAPGADVSVAAPTADAESQLAALRARGVTVTFDDVWFHYGAEPGMTEDKIGAPMQAVQGVEHGTDALSREPAWVLRGVSFTVRPGETLALVGHTGAGKSTIVNVLLRFYEPQRGRILVNDTDIRTIPLDVLRALMGYVQQDIFLFAGDVASNIRLATALSDEDLVRAAERVGADRIVRKLPDGWHHQLSERGVGLSMGERQLLAFARAVAADPALLILDEATSAVDSAIEADIQRAVSVLMHGRTTIAIAHRLSTIMDATEILVLHHGEIIERGSHRELLALAGHYERMVRLEHLPDVPVPPVLPAAATVG